jgi:hypothetical protein
MLTARMIAVTAGDAVAVSKEELRYHWHCAPSHSYFYVKQLSGLTQRLLSLNCRQYVYVHLLSGSQEANGMIPSVAKL